MFWRSKRDIERIFELELEVARLRLHIEEQDNHIERLNEICDAQYAEDVAVEAMLSTKDDEIPF